MKKIIIIFAFLFLAACQNAESNIYDYDSQKSENISQTEKLKSETEDTENDPQNSKNEETTKNKVYYECESLNDNFCFSEWQDYPTRDLGDGIYLSLSPTALSLNIGEERVDSKRFKDYSVGLMATIWSYDFEVLICETFYKDSDSCDRNDKDWRAQYPELLRESIKKSFQENIFYRINDDSEWIEEITNAPNDIKFVGSWVYEFSAPMYIFDVRQQKFLMIGDTMGTSYVYKDKDFVVVQDSGSPWNSNSFPGLYFFFNNGTTAKIHDMGDGRRLKSVKMDGNKVNFIFHCWTNEEECKKQDKEVKITKTFEELFLSDKK